MFKCLKSTIYLSIHMVTKKIISYLWFYYFILFILFLKILKKIIFIFKKFHVEISGRESELSMGCRKFFEKNNINLDTFNLVTLWIINIYILINNGQICIFSKKNLNTTLTLCKVNITIQAPRQHLFPKFKIPAIPKVVT